MPFYNWDNEFATFANENNAVKNATTKNPLSILALKSCIEADEPQFLSEIIIGYKNAHIYALLVCFSMIIPPLRCIEYLISVGTPINESFENNPFDCTPQELLVNQYPCVTRTFQSIHDAINRGMMLYKVSTTTKSKNLKNLIKKPLTVFRIY